MNSTTQNIIDMDDDLKFVPLSLEEPFKSKLQNWNPISNSISNPMTNNFGIGMTFNFPYSNIENINLSRDKLSCRQPLVMPPMLQESSNFRSIDTNLESAINSNTFLNSDTLYCYNSDVKDFWENTPDSYPLPSDILRAFDFSLDFDELDNPRDTSSDNLDSIFKNIENSNSSIFGTLKAYKIPYPIATLLIKRIIKLTLTYNTKVGD